MEYEKKEKKDSREELIEKIVKAMEDEVEYKKPWLEFTDIPYNPTTENSYSGMNFIMLAMQNRADPRWLTFNQVKAQAKTDDKNYYVRKGEKATEIVVYTSFAQKDNDGEIVRNDDGKAVPVRDENGREKKTAKYFSVFNAEQIEGYPRLVENKEPIENFEPVEKLVKAMEATGLKIVARGNAAFYSPSQDIVSVPPIDHFLSQGHYVRTLCHELGHATGHPDRLNRDQSGSMKNGKKEDLQNYAFEELVAELSSYFVCAHLGLKYDSSSHENHAAYLQSWSKALSDKTIDEETKIPKNKLYFSRACSAASKSADYLLAQLNKYEMSNQNEKIVVKAVEKSQPQEKAKKQHQIESVISR